MAFKESIISNASNTVINIRESTDPSGIVVVTGAAFPQDIVGYFAKLEGSTYGDDNYDGVHAITKVSGSAIYLDKAYDEDDDPGAAKVHYWDFNLSAQEEEYQSDWLINTDGPTYQGVINNVITSADGIAILEDIDDGSSLNDVEIGDSIKLKGTQYHDGEGIVSQKVDVGPDTAMIYISGIPFIATESDIPDGDAVYFGTNQFKTTGKQDYATEQWSSTHRLFTLHNATWNEDYKNILTSESKGASSFVPES
jgi:hypothetical protein